MKNINKSYMISQGNKNPYFQIAATGPVSGLRVCGCGLEQTVTSRSDQEARQGLGQGLAFNPVWAPGQDSDNRKGSS